MLILVKIYHCICNSKVIDYYLILDPASITITLFFHDLLLLLIPLH